MKVGILGSSDVAKSLARGFLKEGHEVMLGSREPGKLAPWVRETGKGASSGMSFPLFFVRQGNGVMLPRLARADC